MPSVSHPTKKLLTENERLILTSLLKEDQHGLGLIEEIYERSGIFLSPGTLYTGLKRMNRNGWITESEHVLPDADGNSMRRRYFTLTEEGRKMIIVTLQQLEAKAEETRSLLAQAKDKHRLKLCHPPSSVNQI
ncbi:MAG: helix-turn-helix transcriptional regulator [Kouleothrix sp.]|jgi:DNA-binding PadR family transcriptional regulator|nr:helix-turn-helix transcriptional regulator [Kouleothrix sp.]